MSLFFLLLRVLCVCCVCFCACVTCVGVDLCLIVLLHWERASPWMPLCVLRVHLCLILLVCSQDRELRVKDAMLDDQNDSIKKLKASLAAQTEVQAVTEQGLNDSIQDLMVRGQRREGGGVVRSRRGPSPL